MDREPRRYIVTLPGVPGTHRQPETVTVHLIDRTGPHGLPVYADAGGTFLVEITDQSARPLVSPEGISLPTVLHAQPMP